MPLVLGIFRCFQGPASRETGGHKRHPILMISGESEQTSPKSAEGQGSQVCQGEQGERVGGSLGGVGVSVLAQHIILPVLSQTATPRGSSLPPAPELYVSTALCYWSGFAWIAASQKTVRRIQTSTGFCFSFMVLGLRNSAAPIRRTDLYF